jgi:hypothetical protein
MRNDGEHSSSPFCFMTDSTLTPKERDRYDIIRQCIEGDLTNAVAAARLHLKIRQVQKLKRAVEKRGASGVVHGNRGRQPKHTTDVSTIGRTVAFLKKKQHRDFGPTFAMEQLAAQKKIRLSRERVRTIMIDHDLWKSKQRTGPSIHRAWRERRAMYGELVQFDGSYHDWFEDGSEHCLLAAIDDATSRVPQAAFANNEGVHAVFRFWWMYLEAHGRPVAVYLDKFSTYKINHKAAVDNLELMTQFQRAMKELDIDLIPAHSPEAKGRIERLFGTLQDRLVKEMRLADITLESANAFLTKEYLLDHHTRFAINARSKGNAHRPLTDELQKRLPSIFSVQSKRTVTNDFTIQFRNQWYQLSAQQPIGVYRSDIVTIEERLDGTMHIRLKDRYLAYAPIAKMQRAARPRVTALTTQKPAWKPPVDHPWRRAAEAVAAKKLRHAR